MDDDSGDTGDDKSGRHELREAAFVYDATPRPALHIVRENAPTPEKGGGKVKTSVYLEPGDVRRLSWIAEVEARPQAEVIRDAIRGYRPAAISREFALFDLPGDAPTQDLTQADLERLLEGFGEPGAE